MDSIILEFEEIDVELREALVLAFGDRLTLVEAKSFDGGTANVIQAILPVVSALTPLLVAYLARPKSPPPARRVVVTDSGEVTLEGYSTDEVERLLERVRSNGTKS
jgi:hypothetical protein